MNARYLGFNPIQPLLDSNMGPNPGGYGWAMPIAQREFSFSPPGFQVPGTQPTFAQSLGNFGTQATQLQSPIAPQNQYNQGVFSLTGPSSRMNSTSPAVAAAPKVGSPEALLAENRPSAVPGYINMGIQGLGTLGSLYLGYKALQQSGDAFNFQKNMAQNNYDNALKTYNWNMEDRIRGRYGASTDKAYIDEQVRKRQLGPSGTPESSSRNASNQYSNPYTVNFK